MIGVRVSRTSYMADGVCCLSKQLETTKATACSILFPSIPRMLSKQEVGGTHTQRCPTLQSKTQFFPTTAIVYAFATYRILVDRVYSLVCPPNKNNLVFNAAVFLTTIDQRVLGCIESLACRRATGRAETSHTSLLFCVINRCEARRPACRTRAPVREIGVQGLLLREHTSRAQLSWDRARYDRALFLVLPGGFPDDPISDRRRYTAAQI